MTSPRKPDPPATPPDGVTPFTDSPPRISAAPSPADDFTAEDDNDGDDFEFSAVFDDPETHPTIAADQLFSDGKIRPIYPIFNRDLLPDGVGEKLRRQPLLKLLIEDREASISPSSSLSGDDLDGVPPETYCVWKPGSAAESPGRVRKSSSTGSSCRRLLRDLMVGRSYSDGKEKFMFLAAEEKSFSGEKEAGVEEKKGKGKKGTEMDLMTAYRMFYRENGHWAAAPAGKSGGGGGRRTYLPYKPGIGGFFASMNGFSRVHNPF